MIYKIQFIGSQNFTDGNIFPDTKKFGDVIDVDEVTYNQIVNSGGEVEVLERKVPPSTVRVAQEAAEVKLVHKPAKVDSLDELDESELVVVGEKDRGGKVFWPEKEQVDKDIAGKPAKLPIPALVGEKSDAIVVDDIHEEEPDVVKGAKTAGRPRNAKGHFIKAEK